MATLYVAEYNHCGVIQGKAMQLPLCPKTTQNNVAIGGVTAQSNAFQADTVMIRVHCDAICSVEVGGTNPVATNQSNRFAGNQTEYFFVNPGDKLAVITNV